MAKRKNKFRYHGKCRSCAGPIMDWCDRWDIQNSRLYAFELQKKLLLPYKWCEACRPSAIEFIKMSESIERLSAPPESSLRERPNVQQMPRFWKPKPGKNKIRILPGKQAPNYVVIHRAGKAS